jgi:hypothetical protein
MLVLMNVLKYVHNLISNSAVLLPVFITLYSGQGYWTQRLCIIFVNSFCLKHFQVCCVFNGAHVGGIQKCIPVFG